MLSIENNELLTRVGPGTPMGTLGRLHAMAAGVSRRWRSAWLLCSRRQHTGTSRCSPWPPFLMARRGTFLTAPALVCLSAMLAPRGGQKRNTAPTLSPCVQKSAPWDVNVGLAGPTSGVGGSPANDAFCVGLRPRSMCLPGRTTLFV